MASLLLLPPGRGGALMAVTDTWGIAAAIQGGRQPGRGETRRVGHVADTGRRPGRPNTRAAPRPHRLRPARARGAGGAGRKGLGGRHRASHTAGRRDLPARPGGPRRHGGRRHRQRVSRRHAQDLWRGAWQALPRGQSQCLVLTSPLRRIWSASAERISMEESQAHGEAQAPDEGASRWWQALRASARQAASELLDPALLAAATDTAKDLSELASRKATVLGTLVLDKAHQARELASENLPVLEELAREKVHQAQGLALRAGELASTVGGVALESASGLVDELSARLACVPLHSPAAHPSVALTEARQPRRASGPAARHAADHGRRRRRAACSSCGCDGRLEALCERPGRGGLPARGQVDKLARRRRRCAQPAAVGGGPQGSCAHPLPGAS